MSGVIFSPTTCIKRHRTVTMGISGKCFKVKADGWLVKKIIALVGKWVCVLRRGRAGSTERMMGSDSGLSRRSGCPE